ESVLVGRVQVDGVGVRRLLAVGVDALALVLDEGAGGLQAAVLGDWQTADAAAAVVGRQHALALLVHDQVARAVAAGALLVDELQRPGLGVEAEGADAAALLGTFGVFADTVQKLLVGVDGQEVGLVGLDGQ